MCVDGRFSKIRSHILCKHFTVDSKSPLQHYCIANKLLGKAHSTLYKNKLPRGPGKKFGNAYLFNNAFILGSQVECDRKLEIEERWSSDSDDEVDDVQNDDMQKVDEQSDDMKGIAGNEVPEKSVYEEKREKEQVQKVDDKMSTPVGRKPDEN